MGVGAGLYMYEDDVIVKKFAFAISSPDEFLLLFSLTPSHIPSTVEDSLNDVTSP